VRDAEFGAPAMTEVTTGLRGLLRNAHAYQLLQDALGVRRVQRRIVEEHLRLRAGQTLLDVGCGTGNILLDVPDGVRYIGCDVSAEYVRRARARFEGRGEFLQTSITDLSPANLPCCDRVIAFGVLHHLDDHEVLELMRVAASVLTAGGHLITYDPGFHAEQSWIARQLVARDRGRNVRTPQGYARLAEQYFGSCRQTLLDGHLRIPYSSVVLECSEPRDPGVRISNMPLSNRDT
jgi:SAM-dependent methyltransferase